MYNINNEKFVSASSIIEVEKEKPRKNATVKQCLISTGEYHETYY